jgi:GT2 family glycosyltransferase
MYVCPVDTAVVVLSYNGKLLHADFFPDLVKYQTEGYKVILVDNASTDGTLGYVQANFPDVYTIPLSVNKGFANGYYEGLKQIQAKYYVLLSADFEVTQGWYTPLYKAMEANAQLAAIQPKIKYYRDKNKFEYAGAGGGFIDRWGYMFCRGRIFFTIENDTNQYDNDIEVFWASGGCFFTRAEAYQKVGGLDNELYAHMEEIDLCWRYINYGYTIGYCGASTVYHVGGSVISYGSPQKIYYNFRNNLVLLTKNLPFKHLLYLLPWRMLLDGIAALKALLQLNTKELGAIFKAHMHFYKTFNKWWLKRKASNPNNYYALKHNKGVYQGHIIVDYFLRGKKIFEQLSMKLFPLQK